MLRLIIQTKRKYKKKTQDKNEEKVKEGVRKLKQRKMEKKKKKIMEALKMKLLMQTAQTQISIKTVTSPSYKIQMKKLTQLTLKKKNGLNT